MSAASCIYAGHVRHRRFTPVRHEFRYRLFMMYLDLRELPDLFDGHLLWSANRSNLASFRRSDYFGAADQPLDASIRDAVEEKAGRRPDGPIRMLTHLRYFGHIFNPVTFYFCFDASGAAVRTIVAQITNTPWAQRHAYILTEAGNESTTASKRYRFDKVFHVSPFNPMDLRYDWRFSPPGEDLNVHMICEREAHKVFDATLTLRRREIGSRSLAAALVAYPFMTGKVTAMIHWQALRLWLKRAPYYANPVRGHMNRTSAV